MCQPPTVRASCLLQVRDKNVPAPLGACPNLLKAQTEDFPFLPSFTLISLSIYHTSLYPRISPHLISTDINPSFPLLFGPLFYRSVPFHPGNFSAINCLGICLLLLWLLLLAIDFSISLTFMYYFDFITSCLFSPFSVLILPCRHPPHNKYLFW